MLNNAMRVNMTEYFGITWSINSSQYLLVSASYVPQTAGGWISSPKNIYGLGLVFVSL